MDIFGKGALQIKNLIDSGEISANEVDQYFRDRIEKYNEKLNIYLTIAPPDYNDDLPKGQLSGIPVAVKDNFCTLNLRTTAASKVLANFVPKYESTVTKRLKDAGGSILGKTNMDAWAHGSSTETSDFDETKNPWDLERVPGGSSGGSASAVGAYLSPVAIGSETAGSIRLPAAWTGTIGFKPTYGRVSRYGVAAMGSSLDSPGPMGLNIEDMSLFLSVIAGKDKYDATSVDETVEDYMKEMELDRKFTIGVAEEYFNGVDEDITNSINEMVSTLEKLGHKVKKISMIDPKYAISVYTIIQRAEVSSNLARYHGIRYSEARSEFGNEAKKRTMLGAYTLAVGYYDQYYKKAQKVRTLLKKDFLEKFEEVDMIIGPTTPVTALKIGESDNYPFFGEIMDALVEPSSLAGLPAISVPTGLDSKGLPIGMQIIGNYLKEGEILDISRQLEKETNFNDVIQKGLDKWK